MKHLAAALAVLMAFVMNAPQAEAKWNGGSVRHYTDYGYDAAFKVFCGGSEHKVREGQFSDDVCPDEDVDAIYVAPGTEIKCHHPWNGETFWPVWKDKTGWHEVGNFENPTCVNGLD